MSRKATSEYIGARRRAYAQANHTWGQSPRNTDFTGVYANRPFHALAHLPKLPHAHIMPFTLPFCRALRIFGRVSKSGGFTTHFAPFARLYFVTTNRLPDRTEKRSPPYGRTPFPGRPSVLPRRGVHSPQNERGTSAVPQAILPLPTGFLPQEQRGNATLGG